MNHGASDPEVCILWKQNAKANLSVFDKPKAIIGEPAKSKEK